MKTSRLVNLVTKQAMLAGSSNFDFEKSKYENTFSIEKNEPIFKTPHLLFIFYIQTHFGAKRRNNRAGASMDIAVPERDIRG